VTSGEERALDGPGTPGLMAGSLLGQTYTDGFLVLHRGRIVTERYFNGLRPAGRLRKLLSAARPAPPIPGSADDQSRCARGSRV